MHFTFSPLWLPGAVPGAMPPCRAGGYKESGFGREHGSSVLEHYTQVFVCVWGGCRAGWMGLGPWHGPRREPGLSDPAVRVVCVPGCLSLLGGRCCERALGNRLPPALENFSCRRRALSRPCPRTRAGSSSERRAGLAPSVGTRPQGSALLPHGSSHQLVRWHCIVNFC